MNTFLRGFVSLTSVGLLRSVLMLLIQWIAIQVASKEEYGAYVFSFTFFSIISTLSQNITSDFSFKILSKEEEDDISNASANNIVRFERTVSLVGVVIYGIICCVLGVMKLTQLELTLIFILGLVVIHPLSYLKNALISRDRIQKLAEFELVNIITSFIVSLVLTYYFGIIGLALGQVSLLWLRQCFSWRYHNLFSDSNSRNFPNILMLRKYKAMAIRNGLQNVYQNADIIAMNLLFGASTIAEYKLAKSLASIPSKLLNPLWSSLRGKIFAPYVSGNRKEALSYIVRGVRVVFITYSLLLILNYFFGTALISEVYGADFAATKSYMYWVLLLFLIRDSSLTWFGLLLSVNSWDNMMNWFYAALIALISASVALNVGEVHFFMLLVICSFILLCVSFLRTYIR